MTIKKPTTSIFGKTGLVNTIKSTANQVTAAAPRTTATPTATARTPVQFNPYPTAPDIYMTPGVVTSKIPASAFTNKAPASTTTNKASDPLANIPRAYIDEQVAKGYNLNSASDTRSILDNWGGLSAVPGLQQKYQTATKPITAPATTPIRTTVPVTAPAGPSAPGYAAPTGRVYANWKPGTATAYQAPKTIAQPASRPMTVPTVPAPVKAVAPQPVQQATQPAPVQAVAPQPVQQSVQQPVQQPAPVQAVAPAPAPVQQSPAQTQPASNTRYLSRLVGEPQFNSIDDYKNYINSNNSYLALPRTYLEAQAAQGYDLNNSRDQGYLVQNWQGLGAAGSQYQQPYLESSYNQLPTVQDVRVSLNNTPAETGMSALATPGSTPAPGGGLMGQVRSAMTPTLAQAGQSIYNAIPAGTAPATTSGGFLKGFIPSIAQALPGALQSAGVKV